MDTLTHPLPAATAIDAPAPPPFPGSPISDAMADGHQVLGLPMAKLDYAVTVLTQIVSRHDDVISPEARRGTTDGIAILTFLRDIARWDQHMLHQQFLLIVLVALKLHEMGITSVLDHPAFRRVVAEAHELLESEGYRVQRTMNRALARTRDTSEPDRYATLDSILTVLSTSPNLHATQIDG